jgi:serine O-acetyltransferase
VKLMSDVQAMEPGQGTGSPRAASAAEESSPDGLRAILAADMRASVDGDGGASPSALKVLASVLLLPKVRAVVMLRVAQWFVRRGLRVPALAVQGWTQRVAGADINPWSRIGPGLRLSHSVGIVIGPEVRIGRNAIIYQGVTLGDGSRPGQPRVGDHVTIGAGALVLGGVTVGDGAVIGAGAVVTTDVPAGMVATGVPATVKGPASGAWARIPVQRQG